MHTTSGLSVLFFFNFRGCVWTYKTTHSSIHVCVPLRVSECEVLWSQRQHHTGQIMCIHVISLVYVNPVNSSHDGCLRYIQLAGLPTSWINVQRVHSANSNWCPLYTQFTYIRRHCIAKGPLYTFVCRGRKVETKLHRCIHVKNTF